MRLQSVIHAIYPPQCIACDALTDVDHALCSACWSETEFLEGLVCDLCGVPLVGQDDGDTVHCDDCLTTARPWDHGRAVFAYKGVGRRLVLALKHGDRTDLVPAFASWIAKKAQNLPVLEPVLVPVPLHRLRLIRRKYNQSALLVQAVANVMHAAVCIDALQRTQHTPMLDGHSKDARFSVMSHVITFNAKRQAHIHGRNVLLIDDVMTSGATLAACTEALYAAGAAHVSCVTLARVVKVV